MQTKAVSDNVITANNGMTPLIDPLMESLSHATQIDIISAFVMVSGVMDLEQSLTEAVNRNVEIRILTGRYLNVTEPDAIQLLRNICGDRLDIRFYEGSNSFHPKSYIIHSPDGTDVFVGSSNISHSALVKGVEWNYHLSSKDHQTDCDRFQDEFDHLFEDSSKKITKEVLSEYRKSWTPIRRMQQPLASLSNEIVLNGAQIMALHCLKQTREEGMKRGLVVAATGVGKTMIAAKDSENYKKILFLAHTKEILNQARNTFMKVRKDCDFGMAVDGELDLEHDIVFASVQTLSRKDNIEGLQKDRFDYIVVDEFHHSVSKTYRTIIDHFEPEFLLGLTATPDRLDNRDVYELCQYNVVYEIDLLEAVSRKFLVPFRYFGIYDETDYETIERSNGHYVVDRLSDKLSDESRASSILDNYKRYKTDRAIGFCSTIEHAGYMARYFQDNGIRSYAVASRNLSDIFLPRDEAIEKLEQGEVSVLFTVDLFNEGVDIPSIDMVMFLRPTESPTVFIQQLGRGLRTSEGKRILTVLDFLGNYHTIGKIPSLLYGKEYTGGNISELNDSLPEGCTVDFDLRVIDLFKEWNKRNSDIKSIRKEEYNRIKQTLGHAPSRTEFITYVDRQVWRLIRHKADPFQNWLSFVDSMEDLDPIKKSWMDNEAGEFIRMLEKTKMSKLYKIPTILTFIGPNGFRKESTMDKIATSMKDFYLKDGNIIDITDDKSKNNIESWSLDKWKKLAADQPVHFLCHTENKYFVKGDDSMKLLLQPDTLYNDVILREEVMDILTSRTIRFKRERYGEDDDDPI